jgi:7,8-dihydroneopterin aldolase/epimerase/oxygenase
MIRTILIRDLVVACEIGVYRHEHGRKQRVRINLELDMAESDQELRDELRNTVHYGEIVDRVKALATHGRINLVETLAERIAALCLEEKRVAAVRVRVEKLDVYPDGPLVGVAIQRFNQKD